MLRYLAVVLLAGCAATAKQVPGPDGGTAYMIECTQSQGWEQCYEEAAKVCGGRYAVQDRITGYIGGTEQRRLLVSCPKTASPNPPAQPSAVR
jgi:hypothetical protein